MTKWVWNYAIEPPAQNVALQWSVSCPGWVTRRLFSSLGHYPLQPMTHGLVAFDVLIRNQWWCRLAARLLRAAKPLAFAAPGGRRITTLRYGYYITGMGKSARRFLARNILLSRITGGRR